MSPAHCPHAFTQIIEIDVDNYTLGTHILSTIHKKVPKMPILKQFSNQP